MSPAKGELRRVALLEAAERVLATSGNANASMRHFAAAANVRLGHLQHYFPTRADLMHAVLERALQRSLDQLREVSGVDIVGGDAQMSRSETEQVVAALLHQYSDPATVRLYVEIWAMAASDEEVAAVLRGFYADYAGHVEHIVRRAQPQLAPKTRQAAANSIVAVLEGAAIVRSGFAGLRSDGTDEEILATIQRLLHGQ